MPVPQIILNGPCQVGGFFMKTVFFGKKVYLREYLTGLMNGIRMSKREGKVVFQKCNQKNYVKIQLELWYNIVRRIQIL